MRLLQFPHTAQKVTEVVHVLYDGVSSSPLTLTGTLPTVPFRVQIRLYTATSKTDCVGSVVVGSETLAFTQASKKLTSTLLTALPTVTTSSLNCMIELIAIDSGGKILEDEVVSSFQMRYEPTTNSFENSDGEWITSSAYAMTTDSTVGLDTTVRYLGVDYEVAKVEAFPWLDGNELYRIVYFG